MGAQNEEIVNDVLPQMIYGSVGSPAYKTYRAFIKAKSRCTNSECREWKRYGGRGIKFLFGSFGQFYAELGPRPLGCSVDRINNDGHYEAGNVRWATPKQQAANRHPRLARAKSMTAKERKASAMKAARAAAKAHRAAKKKRGTL